LLAAAASLACVAAACSPNAICRSGGINDPSNRTERRQLLAYGLDAFCKQMLDRSAPLKMTPDAPAIGRFFPQHCAQQTLSNGDLQITFDGFGYAWTNVSLKATFTATGTVEYNQDFRCSDDNAIYAYFPVKQVQSSGFQLHMIEQPLANLAQGWVTPYANSFGTQMLGGQLAQGFTVIRDTDGNTDFDVGILQLGTKPSHPFAMPSNGKTTLEDARVTINQNERDFVGPLRLDQGGVLSITASVDGQPAVGVFVVPRDEGDASLKWYFESGAATKLATEPRITGVMQQGLQYRQNTPLPAGSYYVIFDNTALAGQAAPTNASAAMVSYLIQIGGGS
jgi:hypothetical protein